MFWFLRTGAANFLNSFNNNSNNNTSKVGSKSDKNALDKNSSWLRFRYGRLSVDSDDQNFNKNRDIDDDDDDDDDDVLVDMECSAETNDCDKINVIDSNQYLDANGNTVGTKNQNDSDGNCGDCECSGVQVDSEIKSPIKEPNESYQKNESVMNKLMAMALADFDESLTQCNVCDRAFHCQRQLASHQQKKRHFGCTECDSVFSSQMLMEHHKEEFEHWSDSDEYQQPCCRQNRRDDYDFSDSEAFTSDAESEDLERLL